MNSIRTGCRTFPTKWKQRVHRLDFYSGFTPAAIWFEIQTMLSSIVLCGQVDLCWTSVPPIPASVSVSALIPWILTGIGNSKKKTRVSLIVFIGRCIGCINWLYMFAYRWWLWWQKEAWEEMVCGSILLSTWSTSLRQLDAFSRGEKTSKSFNTSNLHKHLASSNSDQHASLVEEEFLLQRQPTISAVIERKLKTPIPLIIPDQS